MRMRRFTLAFVLLAPILGSGQLIDRRQMVKMHRVENPLTERVTNASSTTQQLETLITSSTDLDALIATANAEASNNYTGVVTRPVAIASAKTIPANVYLEFANSGKFTKNGRGTVAFRGLGLVNPESRFAVFASFGPGDIVWTGTAFPYHLSSELWSDTKLSAKLLRAIAAVTGKSVTIDAYPGDLAEKVTVADGLSLHLTKGKYTNSQEGAYNFTFIAESNTRIYGDGIGQTLLYENPASVQLICASGTQAYPYDGANSNIFVEDISFMGDPSTTVDSVHPAVFLGNVVGGAVRRCSFEKTHGYAAFVGGFSTSNNFADGVWMTDNLMKGLQTQVIGTVGGRNIHISRNTIIVSNLPDSPGAAVIDVEPNANTYGSENLQITDNIIDGRLAQQFYNSITVQKAYSGSVRNLRVAGNQLIGMDNNVNAFLSADISVSSDTITLPDHGLQTGQPVVIAADDNGKGGGLPGGFGDVPRYPGWVIVVNQNAVKIASSYPNAIARVPVDITSAPLGIWLITPAARQSNGIEAWAIESSVIENNYVIGAGENGIDVSGGYGNLVHGNFLVGVGSGRKHALVVNSVKDSHIYENTIISSPQAISQSTDIYETDTWTAPVSTTAGSNVVSVETGGLDVPWWFRGSRITIDGTDYTVAVAMGARIVLTSNAASTGSKVAATAKLSSNAYRGNVTSGIALSPVGTSVIASAGDRPTPK